MPNLLLPSKTVPSPAPIPYNRNNLNGKGDLDVNGDKSVLYNFWGNGDCPGHDLDCGPLFRG